MSESKKLEKMNKKNYEIRKRNNMKQMIQMVDTAKEGFVEFQKDK